MPTLSQIAANRATVEIPCGEPDPATGEYPATLHITYKPNAITPRALHGMLSLDGLDYDGVSHDEQMAALDKVSAIIAGVVIGWDLTQDDGTPIPATREGMQDVDYATQMMILQRIQEHQSLGKTSGTPRSTPSS